MPFHTVLESEVLTLIFRSLYITKRVNSCSANEALSVSQILHSRLSIYLKNTKIQTTYLSESARFRTGVKALIVDRDLNITSLLFFATNVCRNSYAVQTSTSLSSDLLNTQGAF
jgi:hypothetical protein